MDKDAPKDFWIWLFCLVVAIISLVVLFKTFNLNLRDNTNLTLLIILLFGVALIKNIINTVYIFIQFNDLLSSDLFKEHKRNLENAAQSKISISQDFSLTIIENRLLREESWVQLFSNLLITLGMIGTVLGLVISMKGLSDAMDSVRAASQGNISSSVTGLTLALSGMSSAFTTTLAGSVLGGFFLKLLSHSTTNLIEHFIDRIRYEAQVTVIPKLQNTIWNNDVNGLSQAYNNMRNFINTSEQIGKSLDAYNIKVSNAVSSIHNLIDKLQQDTHFMQSSSQQDAQLRLERILVQLNKNANFFNKLIFIFNILVFIVILLIVILLIVTII